jgi:outer membrane protein OmpA-like peptidoglycan-associated protein
MDVNSEQNDGYGSLDINQKQFLFSRTDEEGNSSIYQYNIQKKMIGQVLVLQGHIQDIYDDQPISANVDVIDPNTSQVISRYKADSKGNYYFPLNKGNTYLLDFYKENYSHHFKTIEVENLKTSKTDTLNVKLYDKVELLCNIYDTDIYEPINGEITVIEKSLGREIETPVERRDDGKYLIELPIGKEYKIKVNKEHYNPYDIQLDLTGIVQFNEFERDMEMEQKKKQVEIQVMDEETEEGMAVQLEIKNLDKNETIIRKAHVTEDGLYNIQLREGDKYEININSQKGYAFYNKKIDVGKGNRSSRMDIKLKPLKEETKLSLKNITFETNSAELDAESYEELNRVVDLLKANDNIKIEISAHTDDVGSAVYNQKLSQRRAQSVVEYLKDHDISENQMVSKGYGESKPLFPNNTEENRAKNRRVELEILEVKEEKIEANL